MTAYAKANELKGGNYKKLNLPFENKLLGQPKEIRERMTNRVENFIYNMLVNVLNTKDTAPLAIEAILEANSYDPGPNAKKIEDPMQWTEDKIIERAGMISSDKGPEGDFDD
jgi:fructose-bisphosphate aldolase class II